MDQWYFFIQNGKTLGPVNRDEIAHGIRSGNLGALDMIYRDGEPKWAPLHEFQEFRDLLKDLKTMQLRADKWVVLTKKTGPQGTQYLQRGPYDTSAVKTLLQSGQLSFMDFIWREGDEKWQRINAVDEFSPKPVKWKPDNPLPQDIDFEFISERIDSKNFPLEEEVTSTRIQIPALEPAPKEAGTPDLTLKKDKQEPHYQIKSGFKEPPREKRELKFTERFELPLLPLAIGLGLLSLLSFLWFHKDEIASVWRKQKDEQVAVKEESTPAPEPVKAPAPAPAPAPVETAKPEPAPVEPKREPTYLKMKYRDLSGPKAALVFSTDASSHFAIEVAIEGRAGDVLDQIQYYRNLIVRWKPSEAPTLIFDKYGLPKGRYSIKAVVGKASARGSFFLGIEDSQFKREIERHRKLISLPFQRERRRLVTGIGEFENIVQNLERGVVSSNTGWARFYGKWKASLNSFSRQYLKGVSPSRAGKFVFPTLWMELKVKYQIAEKLSEDLGVKILAKKPVSPSAIRDLLKSVRDQKEQAIRLSLYR